MSQAIDTAFPLALANEGMHVRVVGHTGGQRSAHRLAELGLMPGVVLSVLRDNGGALLVSVGETRLALGLGVAHSVLVREIAPRSNP